MFQNAKENREHVILTNEGQKIFGVLHTPAHLKNYPAILFCHGLGGQKIGRYRLYVELSRQLALLGIATLRIDFRGCGDSEGDFADLTLEGEISDALLGMKFLQQQPNIDKSRLALFGRSMGGAVAVITASRFKHIKSMCLWAPMFSAKDWEHNWQKYKTEHINPEHLAQMMTFDGQTAGINFFKELFEMKLEEDLISLSKLPILLIHGNQDNLVPTDHSEQYIKTRLQADAETKYIQLPKSDHHFSHIQERQMAMQETCNWFVETLLNN